MSQTMVINYVINTVCLLMAGFVQLHVEIFYFIFKSCVRIQ